MVIEHGVDCQRIELLYGRVGVQVVIELPGTVDILEEHAEPVLWNNAPARAALDANPAIDVEALLAVGPHVFDRAGAFPRDTLAAGIGVNAAGAKDVVPLHHDAQRGNAEEVALEGVAVKRILSDVRA